MVNHQAAVLDRTFAALADPTRRALLARLGFRETGRAERTFQLGEEWCDSLYLSLRRADVADRS